MNKINFMEVFLPPLSKINLDVVVPISKESGCKSITFQADLIQRNALETASQKVSVQMPPSVKWKFHNSKNDKFYTSWLKIDSNSCPNETPWGIRFQLPEGALLQSASSVD